MRGIAIALVLAEHFGLSAGRSTGLAGVWIFFALSGFLITRLLVAERQRTGRINLRAFYVRRFRRLMPALVVLVAVVALLGLPGNALVALTYTTNWYVVLSNDTMGALRHTWSLALEEQFYLAWPLLFLVLGRRAPAFLAFGVVVVVGLVSTRFLHSTLVNDAIMAGCLLALRPIALPRLAGWLGWIMVAGALLLPPDEAARPMLTIVTIAAILIIGSPGITWRPLVRLGEFSYGLYLWHFPVAFMLRPQLEGGSPLLPAAIGIALAVALALLSERFVERPFRLARVGSRHDERPSPVDRGGVRPRAAVGPVADHDFGRVRSAGERDDGRLAGRPDPRGVS